MRLNNFCNKTKRKTVRRRQLTPFSEIIQMRDPNTFYILQIVYSRCNRTRNNPLRPMQMMGNKSTRAMHRQPPGSAIDGQLWL